MNFKGKFCTSIVIHASDDGKVPAKIKVLPRGTFHTTKYGELTVSDETMHQMITNFDPQVRPISIDRDHAPTGDTRAAGWIEKLIKGEDGLYADVKWTPYGEKLVGNREYRMLSPEWSYNYVDSEDSAEKGAALLAVALTNRPLFKSVGVLKASDLTTGEEIFILQSNSMKLKDILLKAAADRTPEEIKFLADNQGEMTDEQKKQVEAEQKEAEDKAKAEKEAADKAEKEKKDAEAKAANAGDKVTITASELEQYKALAQKNKELEEAQLRASIETKVDSYIANDQKETRILAAARDKAITFLMSLNDSQRTDFYEIADQLPGVKILGEKGKGGDKNSSLTAQAKLDKLTAEKMQANDKLTAYDAEKLVLKENKELREELNEK